MRRAFGSIFALVIGALGMPAPSSAEDPAGRLEEVVAVIPGHFPPQYVVNEAGEVTGFAVDVAERVADLAGLRLRYSVVKNWKAASDALKNGRVDVSINNGVTEERKAYYDFTSPVETYRVSLFVRDDTHTIRDLDDLAGRKVAVEKTHVGVALLKGRDDIELVLTDDTPETLFALLSGHVDAMVYAEPVIWRVAREARVDGRIKVVGPPLVEIKRAMAVRKGNARLLARLERAIKAFVGSAEYREIYAKWYGRREPFWTVARVIWVMGTLLLLSLGAMAGWRHRSVLKLNRDLRDRGAHLATAQRIAQLGSYEWDVARDRLTWSDETYRIFGQTKEAFQPTVDGFVSHIHPDDRAAVKTVIDAALAKAEPYDATFRIFRADGEVRILHDQGEVDCNASGKPLRMRGVAHDVTEQSRTEEEIRKLNEELEQRVEARTAELHAAQEELVRKERLAALGQLTATVSHELRNPLGAMRPALAAINELTDADNDLLRRSVELVDRSVTRCDNIIGDLLDYSRVRELQPEATAVDGWLGALLDEYEPPAGVTLRRDLACGAASALDHERMRRVVINLLDNACQAMTDQNAPGAGDRVVTVASRLAGERLEISVADTGPGIAPERVGEVFEPLYSTKAFGVGLGLAIVKRIAEQHGGGIEVENGTGGGARFVVSLPLQVPAQRAAS